MSSPRYMVKARADGAIVLTVETRTLRARIVDGVVELWEPPVFSEAEVARIESRRAICEPCDQSRGLHRLTVKCAGCKCSGVSLLDGACKLGKWST